MCAVGFLSLYNVGHAYRPIIEIEKIITHGPLFADGNIYGIARVYHGVFAEKLPRFIDVRLRKTAFRRAFYNKVAYVFCAVILVERFVYLIGGRTYARTEADGNKHHKYERYKAGDVLCEHTPKRL